MFKHSESVKALVQMEVMVGEANFDRIAYSAGRAASQAVGVAVSLMPGVARLNWPLRMRWISSIPEIVVAAFLNRLNPSMAFVRGLIFDRLLRSGYSDTSRI